MEPKIIQITLLETGNILALREDGTLKIGVFVDDNGVIPAILWMATKEEIYVE